MYVTQTIDDPFTLVRCVTKQNKVGSGIKNFVQC